jgi:peptide/nickel transport system ATP-binding protein
VQAEVLDLLRDLRRRFNLSVLLITHDLGVVAEMADRVAVMYCGRVVEHSSVQDLFRAPAHPYTRGLLASIPGATPGSRLTAIPGTVPPLGRFGEGCAFSPRCPDCFDPCAAVKPDLTQFGGDHDVRCHLHAPEYSKSRSGTP